VKAERGKEGGYALACPAESIVIADVITAPGRPSLRGKSLRRPFRPSPHLHPFRGLLRAFPLARRCKLPSTRFLAKPLCATCLQNEEEMNSWVRTIPGPNGLRLLQ